MRLTILRGISGSGKSTWAQRHAHEAVVVSTDAYFVDADGIYRFDANKLQDHHRRCFREALEAMLAHEPWIIVDNTNLCAWEFSPYVLAGEALGYTVEILSIPCTLACSTARKAWLQEDQLARSLARFEEETRRLPSRFRPLHHLLPLNEPQG